jgi:hypothetical protein
MYRESFEDYLTPRLGPTDVPCVGRGRCPLWVRSCRGPIKSGCPLCSQKLPRLPPTGAAAKGHKLPHGLHNMAAYRKTANCGGPSEIRSGELIRLRRLISGIEIKARF